MIGPSPVTPPTRSPVVEQSGESPAVGDATEVSIAGGCRAATEIVACCYRGIPNLPAHAANCAFGVISHGLPAVSGGYRGIYPMSDGSTRGRGGGLGCPGQSLVVGFGEPPTFQATRHGSHWPHLGLSTVDAPLLAPAMYGGRMPHQVPPWTVLRWNMRGCPVRVAKSACSMIARLRPWLGCRWESSECGPFPGEVGPLTSCSRSAQRLPGRGRSLAPGALAPHSAPFPGLPFPLPLGTLPTHGQHAPSAHPGAKLASASKTAPGSGCCPAA